MKKTKKKPAAKANRTKMEDLSPKADPKAGLNFATNASLNFTKSSVTDGTSNTVLTSVPAVQDSFLKIR
jgi:hypothetical protein